MDAILSNLEDTAALLSEMRARRGQRVVRRWLGGLKVYERRGGMLMLTAPDERAAEEISLLFGGELRGAAQALWPGITAIRIKPAVDVTIKAIRRKLSPQLSLELAA